MVFLNGRESLQVYLNLLHIRIKSIHLIGWTLHVAFTIQRYRLWCWYRPVQKPYIDWCYRFLDSLKYFCAFILCVSDSGLQCNKHNSYWYEGKYQDRQTALGSSVYHNIALHISNYYTNVFLLKIPIIKWQLVGIPSTIWFKDTDLCLSKTSTWISINKYHGLFCGNKNYFTVSNYKLHLFLWVLVTVPSIVGGE